LSLKEYSKPYGQAASEHHQVPPGKTAVMSTGEGKRIYARKPNYWDQVVAETRNEPGLGKPTGKPTNTRMQGKKKGGGTTNCPRSTRSSRKKFASKENHNAEKNNSRKRHCETKWGKRNSGCSRGPDPREDKSIPI